MTGTATKPSAVFFFVSITKIPYAGVKGANSYIGLLHYNKNWDCYFTSSDLQTDSLNPQANN